MVVELVELYYSYIILLLWQNVPLTTPQASLHSSAVKKLFLFPLQPP